MLNLATQEAANLERPKGAERPLFLFDKNGCPEGDEGSRGTQQLLFSSSNFTRRGSLARLPRGAGIREPSLRYADS
jgi:hypothetical protein